MCVCISKNNHDLYLNVIKYQSLYDKFILICTLRKITSENDMN
jgi:hypothetical protein